MSFLNSNELEQLGLGACGNNVKISKHASLHNPSNIYLGNNVRIDDFAVISACGKETVEIGNYVHIGCHSGLYGNQGIQMHDFSGISSRVAIYSESDDFTGMSLTNPTVPKKYRKRTHTGRVIIGKHVVIGTCSTVLPNCKLEAGCAVAAYTLVQSNLESGFIYSGVPARKIGERQNKIFRLEKELLSNQ